MANKTIFRKSPTPLHPLQTRLDQVLSSASSAGQCAVVLAGKELWTALGLNPADRFACRSDGREALRRWLVENIRRWRIQHPMSAGLTLDVIVRNAWTADDVWLLTIREDAHDESLSTEFELLKAA